MKRQVKRVKDDNESFDKNNVVVKIADKRIKNMLRFQ
jgi:hypothetical protein